MSNANSTSVDQHFLANSMASFIQIGAVILALGYELVKLWMAPNEPEPDMAESATEAR